MVSDSNSRVGKHLIQFPFRGSRESMIYGWCVQVLLDLWTAIFVWQDVTAQYRSPNVEVITIMIPNQQIHVFYITCVLLETREVTLEISPRNKNQPHSLSDLKVFTTMGEIKSHKTNYLFIFSIHVHMLYQLLLVCYFPYK